MQTVVLFIDYFTADIVDPLDYGLNNHIFISIIHILILD